MQWMIYGANGYTGELIAREAVRRGKRPVLAGRNTNKIAAVASELGLAYRIFGLDNHQSIDQGLDGISLVLHCAGPFSQTSAPMVAGCLRNRSHYLDITGEISVFEHVQLQHAQAHQVGVVLCPGVGFDVIPTDCIALALKEALPDATHLSLGFDGSSAVSPGTAKTTVEFAAAGGKIRRNSQIISVPLAYGARRIDFGNGLKPAMTIPWGDVSTAFHSTGIPNIRVYIPAHAAVILGTRAANLARPLLQSAVVTRTLQNIIGRFVKGPATEVRARTPTYVWGEATNALGKRISARVQTANGYSLTITGTLAVVEYLLGHTPAGGAYTPSRLMGSSLIATLPESGPIIFKSEQPLSRRS